MRIAARVRGCRYGGEVTEVPDADFQEQQLPVRFDDALDDEDEEFAGARDDVPEADAQEQARVVPLDEDEE